MEVLYERCCGIDVHRSSIAACILLEQKHKPQKHLRRFSCTTRDLQELAEWLRSFDVRHVAMESTGVYWKPVWNMLEEHFHMVLANAQHIKAVPGRKTGMMDCQWIGELLRHGLLRGSYVGMQEPLGRFLYGARPDAILAVALCESRTAKTYIGSGTIRSIGGAGRNTVSIAI
ncbi:IS110 family transposase [Edaphobacter aggregans]|uniref:IS110 family transposase n=1 Tax=Edaphobacter aggregans TaxID=570835 RepID=UPI000A045655|nr:transposase [Edaphobacter aggregans]